MQTAPVGNAGEYLMKLLAVTPLGRNRETSRLWIESRRLEALGFPPGMPFSVEGKTEELILKRAILAENHVSSRAVPDGRRPIIDLANQTILRGLVEYPELKRFGENAGDGANSRPSPRNRKRCHGCRDAWTGSSDGVVQDRLPAAWNANPRQVGDGMTWSSTCAIGASDHHGSLLKGD